VLEAQDSALVLGEGAEGLREQARDGLAANASGLDEAGDPEATEMPRHEGLAQPDALDELGYGCLALGEALDDSQAIHVREGLVDEAQGAQVLGLVDDGRDGRADVCGGRCQSMLRIPGPDRVLAVDGSMLIYINMH
jgi:hypothetical protein